MALSFIPFAFPGAPGVRCAFQTRDWGVSEGPYGGGNIAYTVGDDPLRVSANRLDLAASLELAEIAELDQIHGDTLVFDPPPSPLERFVEPPAFPKGDGLATDKPGIGLIIKEWGPDFANWFNARDKTMNLWRLTRDQLLEAGLPDEGIFGLDLCTASMPDSFFSYRRDGICGRQANVIWIA